MKAVLNIASVAFFTLSCVTTRVLPTLEISVTPLKFREETEPSIQLAKLSAIDQNDDDWSLAKSDLEKILRAQHMMALRQYVSASEMWLQIVREQEGALAELAFREWLKAMRSIIGKNVNDTELARFFWSEKGHESWLGRRRRLTDVEKIRRYIVNKEPFRKESEIASELSQLKGKDPLLERTAKLFCESENKDRLTPVIKNLDRYVQKYFKALTLICGKQREAALKILFRLAVKLDRDREYHPLAVNSYRKIVDIYRYLGDREQAANGYTALVRAMNSKHLNYKSMGLESDFEWRYEKINTTLWAGRYRALVGDYLNAKIYVQTALSAIKQEGATSKKQSEKLAILKAEAHHILASRIYLEQSDLDAAFLQNKLGLSIDGLTNDWIERLTWYQGWYLFLSEKHDGAIKAWKTLLDMTESPAMREKVLFWMARSFEISGRDEEFEKTRLILGDEFPISFYTIYGFQAFRWPKGKWVAKFSDRIFDSKVSESLDIGPIAEDEKLNRLRIRAELALMIKSESLGRVTAKELFLAGRRLNLKYTESHLYITRLLNMNHEHALAMGHTTSLLSRGQDLWFNYPNQLSIYYPSPMPEVFANNHEASGVSSPLIKSIARQESAFRPDVISWAGAVGLLQIMPKTAETLSGMRLPEKKMIERLKKPIF